MSALADDLTASVIPGVTEIVTKIRSSLEKSFPFIWVRGEITGFSRALNGHVYFSLKDSQSLLKAVWFASQQKREQKFNQLTGEVYESPLPSPEALLDNGLEVICGGTISYYGKGGTCQLVVEHVQLYGAGMLAQAFEAMKKRMLELGYFAYEHKKPLPVHPAKIALVTSERGAAIHDFFKIGRALGLSSTVRLFPVPVQGKEAAGKIAEALELINLQNWADSIVLIRGGGSKEDLWSFNEECVVRAIYNSRIPVLTGIGHEIDQSLADLAADRAAATPTHAAQLLWPSRAALKQDIEALEIRLLKTIERNITERCQALLQNVKLLEAHSPMRQLEKYENFLAERNGRLSRAANVYMAKAVVNLANLTRLLQNFSPLAKVLAYIGDSQELAKKIEEIVNGNIKDNFAKLEQLERRLQTAVLKRLEELSFSLDKKTGILKALNPESLLGRGYALVYSGNRLLVSVKDVSPGQAVEIRLNGGSIIATVQKVKTGEDN